MVDALISAYTIATLLIIGGVELNPGPNQILKNQLQLSWCAGRTSDTLPVID